MFTCVLLYHNRKGVCITKRLLSVFLILMLLTASAAADPLTSYADVQRLLLAAAYKVAPFDVSLSGTVAAVVPSSSFANTWYLFVLVDPDDVAMWSLEDDNFFYTIVSGGQDTCPWEPGDAVTVEGQVVSVYSSPTCPYIAPGQVIKQ